MTRTRAVALAVAEGAAIHTAITATGLGALALWARLCEAHKHRAGRSR
jgi:hypothetical protein